MTPDMAIVTPLNNPGGPEGDTVTVDEQLLNTEYWRTRLGDLKNKQGPEGDTVTADKHYSGSILNTINRESHVCGDRLYTPSQIF